MLTEKQMDAALAIFQARMEEISEIYFEKMGKHIRQIGQLAPSDVHRLQQLRRLNRNLADIEKRLAKAADLNIRDLETVLREAAKADERVVKKITGVSDAEVRLENNVPLQRALRAQLLETGGRMANLSNTTVVESAYRNAVDAAVTAAQSGAEDYESAIRRTLARAGEMGLRVRENGTKAVAYASGRSLRVDTAVRMNVLDAMRRMNQRAMEEVGRQFGADGVEIDAHMLCAEDHLPYQGGQYSNEEFGEIQDSLDRPFGEWNCRHTWSPIILGVSPPAYPEEELERFRKYSTEEVTIDGQTRTRYEWSQVMRRMETAIREKKDTAILAKAAGDGTLQRQCQGTINALMKRYEILSDKAGLGPDFRRTYVAGFRDVKVEKPLTAARTIFDADGNAVFSHVETTEIEKATSFDSIAEYFHYEDKMGHLRSVLNDNMAEADLPIVKEIAEGIRWAKDTYGLSDAMPRTIMLGDLDKNVTGVYNLRTREITISREIPIEQAFLTAVHEMTHFVDDIRGQQSARIVTDAITALEIAPDGIVAIRLKHGVVNNKIQYADDPMELLAYSVEKSITGKNNRLGEEIARRWFGGEFQK